MSQKRTSRQVLGTWQEDPPEHFAGQQVRVFWCGELHALVDGDLAHMSISAPNRYPTWDEIAHARYALLPRERNYGFMLPPESEYVNITGGSRGGNIFHLWEVTYDSPEARIGRMLMRGLR